MSAAELTALLLFCTAMSFSPGPNTTLSTALAANLGLKRALRFCLAVPAGWTLLMLGSGLGLGALITGVPALRWAVTLLGVAYMLWLAFKLSRAGQLTEVDSNPATAARPKVTNQGDSWGASVEPTASRVMGRVAANSVTPTRPQSRASFSCERFIG